MLANAIGSQPHPKRGPPSSTRRPPTPPGNSSSSSSSSKSKKGGGGSPGGNGPPSNSPGGPLSVGGSSPSSSDDKDPYKWEKKNMRVKLYENMKIPALPQDAAKCRAFCNSIYSIVCKFAKTDESEVFNWIVMPNTSEVGNDFMSSGKFPILDRILGAKLLEQAKSTKFALEFQTLQERFQALHKQPKGRYLLWHIFQKFRLDRDRGTALSHIICCPFVWQGSDVKALEEFKQRYAYCYGSLEATELPAENALRSLLFENLKNHPKMALSIDKYREANPGSSKRTSTWLYGKMVEAIEISQMDVNTTSVDKALQGGGQDSKIAGAQAETKEKAKKEEKPEKKPKESKKEKGDKNEKPEKKEKTKTSTKKSEQGTNVDAAAASKGKGKGKGDKKGKGEKPELTKEQKSKLPCMYFAYDSCTKGKDCEFLHDKAKLYKGPKPRLKGDAPSSSQAAELPQ